MILHRSAHLKWEDSGKFSQFHRLKEKQWISSGKNRNRTKTTKRHQNKESLLFGHTMRNRADAWRRKSWKESFQGTGREEDREQHGQTASSSGWHHQYRKWRLANQHTYWRRLVHDVANPVIGGGWRQGKARQGKDV